jgi:hypothetical protein
MCHIVSIVFYPYEIVSWRGIMFWWKDVKPRNWWLLDYKMPKKANHQSDIKTGR